MQQEDSEIQSLEGYGLTLFKVMSRKPGWGMGVVPGDSMPPMPQITALKCRRAVFGEHKRIILRRTSSGIRAPYNDVDVDVVSE